jgi:hypothetical protein
LCRYQKLAKRSPKSNHQNEIAELVELNGLEQIFDIMTTIRAQFVSMIQNYQWNSERQFGSEGTLPEMLKSPASVRGK